LDITQAIVLALIQGITEFLPISSSGHLVLPSQLLGWPDQGLAFDTAVHFGSLVAVMAYFRRDILTLIPALLAHPKTPSDESRFAINLIIASLPVIPVGFLARFFIEDSLRGLEVIATTTIVFGVALYIADRIGKKSAPKALSPRTALAIGCAQCLALIPGTSRSGITITMALLLGHSREEATRISFLIAIPAIAGAATIKIWDLWQSPIPIDWVPIITGTVLAGISAYLCIMLLLNFINRIGFTPFVIYRIALGGLLWWMIV
jgi:undecaprenyl-diphosphatase